MHATHDFEVILCPTLIDEIRKVISRPKITRLIPTDLATSFLTDVLETADGLHEDPTVGPPITRDRDDDYLIALARQTGADAIISGDRDLLDWPEQTPPVLTPATFDARLSKPR